MYPFTPSYLCHDPRLDLLQLLREFVIDPLLRSSPILTSDKLRWSVIKVNHSSTLQWHRGELTPPFDKIAYIAHDYPFLPYPPPRAFETQLLLIWQRAT